jgi:uncharacterized lipoprotein YehR (DUF1307 family)
MVVAILLTILLVGCGQQEAPTTEVTNPINTIEVETIETEDILVEDIIVEDNITYWEDVDKNAKDLRHDLAEQNLYFNTLDGAILIWGTDYCYEDNKLMAKVEFDESTEEIQTVTINSTIITKDVYDLLGEYTNEFILDQFL